MYELFLIFLGCVIGFIAHLIMSTRRKYDGMFVVDDSDEETTRWTLQYDGDPTEIPKKKFVLFRVHIKK